MLIRLPDLRDALIGWLRRKGHQATACLEQAKWLPSACLRLSDVASSGVLAEWWVELAEQCLPAFIVSAPAKPLLEKLVESPAAAMAAAAPAAMAAAAPAAMAAAAPAAMAAAAPAAMAAAPAAMAAAPAAMAAAAAGDAWLQPLWSRLLAGSYASAGSHAKPVEAAAAAAAAADGAGGASTSESVPSAAAAELERLRVWLHELIALGTAMPLYFALIDTSELTGDQSGLPMVPVPAVPPQESVDGGEGMGGSVAAPIIFANEPLRAASGYTPHELISSRRGLQLLQGACTEPHAALTIETALRSGQPCVAKITHQAKDGLPQPMLVAIQTVGPDPCPPHEPSHARSRAKGRSHAKGSSGRLKLAVCLALELEPPLADGAAGQGAAPGQQAAGSRQPGQQAADGAAEVLAAKLVRMIKLLPTHLPAQSASAALE